MSPCCLAAAAATAALTVLIVAGLSAFVLVTDGFGLGLLAAALLAAGLQSIGWIGPCPSLLNALSTLLAARAVVLLSTTRRPLVVATLRAVYRRATRLARRAAPAAPALQSPHALAARSQRPRTSSPVSTHEHVCCGADDEDRV